MTYILDACALIALLDHEPGWEKVYALVMRANAGDILLYIHIVNLLEVYYGIRREKGAEAAQVMLDDVDTSAVQITNDVSIPLIREAGRFKITYDMSLADTFVCASASLLSATLVTADGELKPVEAAEPLTFFWFRPPKEKPPKKSEPQERIVFLDEKTARYIKAKAEATHQTPAELVAGFVHKDLATAELEAKK
jgi:predicted nucleic acid-binding protein